MAPEPGSAIPGAASTTADTSTSTTGPVTAGAPTGTAVPDATSAPSTLRGTAPGGTVIRPSWLPAPGATGPGTTAPGPPPSQRPWARVPASILRPLVIYLSSRVVVGIALAIAAAATGHRAPGGKSNVLDVWDGRWFLRAAANGWPSPLPMKHGHVAANTTAFFPAFPLAIRWLSDVTGLPQLAAGALISSVTGLTATIAVWMLVRHFAGPDPADRGAALLAFFPGTFVFSLVYSEGIAVTCVAFGLLALLRRRWWLAGLLGLVATATTPVALAFVASCAWCSGRAVLRKRGRDWWSLLAPGLSVLGFLGYMGWLWSHTGQVMAWRLTERGGWNSYPSLAYVGHVVVTFTRDPLSSTITTDLLAAGLAVAVVGAVLAVRQRQPTPVLLYGLVAAAMAAASAPVGLRPRFLLVAFPLVVAIGTRFRGWRYVFLLGCSAALLFTITLLSVASAAVFP